MSVFFTDENGNVQIAYEKLSRGLYIAPTEICEATGLQEDTANYAFTTLKIRDEIERWSLENGDPLLTKGEGRGIRVLHHKEAAEYLWDRFQASLRALQRINGKHYRIDSATFSDDEKKTLDHHSRVISGTTRSALAEAKQLGAPVDQPARLQWKK